MAKRILTAAAIRLAIAAILLALVASRADASDGGHWRACRHTYALLARDRAIAARSPIWYGDGTGFFWLTYGLADSDPAVCGDWDIPAI